MNSQRKTVLIILVIVAVLIVAFLVYSFYTDSFINLNTGKFQKSPARVDIDFNKNKVGVPINDSLT